MKKFILNFKNKEGLLKNLFLITLIGAIISIIVFVIITLMGITLKNYNDNLFSDFGETLCFSIMDNPYNKIELSNTHGGMACIYPPIAYMMLYPFALICKKDLKDFLSLAYKNDANLTLSYFTTKPMFILSYILFFVITMSIILFLVAKISKLKGKNLVYLLSTVFTSGAVFYGFLRGNTIFICVLLILLFVYLYESDKWYLKQISFISLALAIAIKIYPIFFVGFLFYKKGFKKGFIDILNVGLYTAILVFIPFIFTNGGLSNVKLLITNAFGFTSNDKRGTNLTNISVYSMIFTIFKFIGLTPTSNIVTILSYLITIPFLITGFIFPLFSKSKTTAIMFALNAYLIIQNTAYAYVVCLYLVGLIVFIKDYDELTDKEKKLHLISLILILASPIYLIKMVKIITIVLMVCHVMISIDLIKGLKQKKESIECYEQTQ